VRPLGDPAPDGANVFTVVTGALRFEASLRDGDSAAGAPVQFVFAGDAADLARRPTKFRFRYAVP
jgi:hypothetical protein